jgi:hypothetical protein
MLDIRQAELTPPAPLAALLARAVPYDSWRAPFDPTLAALCRRVGRFSIAFLAATTFGTLVVAVLMDEGFFRVLEGPIEALLGHWKSLLLYACGMLALWWMVQQTTDGLTVGTPLWHRIAFLSALAGTPQPVIVGLITIVIAVNLVVWILIYVMWMIIILIVISAALGRR